MSIPGGYPPSLSVFHPRSRRRLLPLFEKSLVYWAVWDFISFSERSFLMPLDFTDNPSSLPQPIGKHTSMSRLFFQPRKCPPAPFLSLGIVVHVVNMLYLCRVSFSLDQKFSLLLLPTSNFLNDFPGDFGWRFSSVGDSVVWLFLNIPVPPPPLFLSPHRNHRFHPITCFVSWLNS